MLYFFIPVVNDRDIIYLSLEGKLIFNTILNYKFTLPDN